MSNEPPENAFPRTKIQSGGFRGPSQAIRKIHVAASSRQAASFWCMTDTQSPITTVQSPIHPLPRYLPICWHCPSSGVRNSEFFASIFQRFDFRARNYIVWEVKLMCLPRQTILFGSRNNIIPGTFCLFSENRMYSFLKSKAFSGRFVCNHSRFISRLSDFRKVWVSRKGGFGQTCIAHPPYQYLFVIRQEVQQDSLSEKISGTNICIFYSLSYLWRTSCRRKANGYQIRLTDQGAYLSEPRPYESFRQQ